MGEALDVKAERESVINSVLKRDFRNNYIKRNRNYSKCCPCRERDEQIQEASLGRHIKHVEQNRGVDILDIVKTVLVKLCRQTICA